MICTVDIHKQYREDAKKFPVKFRMRREKFMAIASAMNEAVVEAMLEGHEFKLPYRCGILTINKSKHNWKDMPDDLRYLKPDFNKCWQIWREKWPDKTDEEIKTIKDKPLVYFLNEHSDGYKASIRWRRLFTYTKRIGFYKFFPAKSFRRKLAQKMKQENGHNCFEEWYTR